MSNIIALGLHALAYGSLTLYSVGILGPLFPISAYAVLGLCAGFHLFCEIKTCLMKETDDGDHDR